MHGGLFEITFTVTLINHKLRYKHEVRMDTYQVGSRSMINLGTMVTLLLIAVVGCSFLLFFQRYESRNQSSFHTVRPVQIWNSKTIFKHLVCNGFSYKANRFMLQQLIKWSRSVYTVQILCFTFIGIFKIKETWVQLSSFYSTVLWALCTKYKMINSDKVLRIWQRVE